MTQNTLMVALVNALAIAACSASSTEGTAIGSSSQPAAPAETAGEGIVPALSPDLQGSPQAPVVVRWEATTEDLRQGGTVTLRLRVERSDGWPLPITVNITVPEGVRVGRGEIQQTLAVNTAPGVEVLVFEIAIDRLPQDDLVAVVDSRSEGAGFHAEPHYRFGRAEPEEEVPVRDGPNVHIGGHDLGPSIRLEPAQQQDGP
jgi:hypothetical protein